MAISFASIAVAFPLVLIIDLKQIRYIHIQPSPDIPSNKSGKFSAHSRSSRRSFPLKEIKSSPAYHIPAH